MINEVKLIGHAGKDAAKKTFSNGNSIVELPLATTKSWKDKTTGEWKDKTAWHNLVFNSDYAEKIKKGDLVYISGELDYRTYEKDGQTKYVTDIRVHSFRVLVKREQSEQTPVPQPDGTTAGNDDLLF